ncbi:MAG: hypothetical protein K2Z81_24750 [Cyanobacteria bacterium]|nr:hypothetical protein [Cyanobacteriota bacterium]
MPSQRAMGGEGCHRCPSSGGISSLAAMRARSTGDTINDAPCNSWTAERDLETDTTSGASKTAAGTVSLTARTARP